MKESYHEEEVFENRTFIAQDISNAVFEYCRLVKCNLSGIVLNGGRFVDCELVDCNLSMSRFAETQLSNVSFDNCKLLGCNFSGVSAFLFDVKFKKCILDYASFEKLKMPKTPFIDCSMKGADFSNADLSSSEFIRTDLTDAVFGRTKLCKANLTTAYSYIIDPAENNLKQARFSITGLSGLLARYDIVIE
ncbi:pentapeptide repeat-containing protein [Viscerimonas tarda]